MSAAAATCGDEGLVFWDPISLDARKYCDVLGLEHARALRLGRRGVPFVQDLRDDFAGTDVRAAYAALVLLEVDHLAQRVHAALRRAVGRAGERQRAPARDGRHVDDEPVLARAHVREDRVHQVEGAVEVRVDERVPVVDGDAVHGAAGHVKSRVVHEDVDGLRL